MNNIKDPYDRGYRAQGVSDLIYTMNVIADKADIHAAFKEPVSTYISLPPRLREIATKLTIARDNGNGAELDILMPQAIQALDFNADHVIRFSQFHNDASYLQNAGYEFKVMHSVKTKVNLLDLVPGITLKHVDGVSGAYTIILKRAKIGAIVELQWTETPNIDDSWKGIGDGTFKKSRNEVRGGEPTKRIFVRGRYHEDGAVGRWCTPISIILL